jgi:cell division protease FtsH
MTPQDKQGLNPPSAEESNRGYTSRARDEDRLTRKRMELWDRSKLFLLFVGSWLVLMWVAMAQFDPLISREQAFNQTLRGYWWLLALAALELIRQLHYFVSEHWAFWHRTWTGLFGRVEKRTGRMNDWTRFRVSRVLKLLFILLIADLLLAKIYHLPPATALIQLPIVITKALPLALQLAFAFFFIIFQFIGLFWFLSRGGVDVYMPDDIKTRFTDVKGQDAVLKRVQENIIFLEDPESIEERGGYVPGGILLWGPPGTGKTLMAQAVAGETSRPFVFVEPGNFINMFFGVGILKVKGLYRKLRKLALRHGGVIVFFDEADSLGNRGSGGTGFNSIQNLSPWSAPGCNGLAYLSRETASLLLRESLRMGEGQERPGTIDRIIAGAGMGGGGMGTLQSLLAEMSGLKNPRGFFNRVVRRILGMRPKPPPKYRILHIFATNRPDVLDEAMLRPGRIDRIYKVGYPSKEGRRETYEYYLEKVKHVLTPDQIDRLAIMTPYATGAGIQDTVNEALVIAVRDGRDAIEWKDILRAKQLKEHGLPDDFEYIERERHATAIHEACHAVVSYRMRKHAVIDMATIERRGDIGGFVSFIPLEDQLFNWKSEWEVDIMGSLASLAGERMFFDDDSSAGVGQDLRNATRLATIMEAYTGMGSSIGSHSVTKFGITVGRSSLAAEDGTDRNLLETELGRRVEALLQDFYERTQTLLEGNRREVLAVAHALETSKTISGEDVAAIIEGSEGPIIDGRAYRHVDFEEMAEAYHVQAVAAHKEHAKVSVPLPVLPALALGAGNGEVPDRPDVSGNGEALKPAGAADGDGAEAPQGQALTEKQPGRRGRRDKDS